MAEQDRITRFRQVAKAALDLAEWAAEGRSDYFLASQIQLLTRYFSKAVDESPTMPDLAAILDFLGSQVQSVVGRAQMPTGTPATRAVAPPEETKLEAHR